MDDFIIAISVLYTMWERSGGRSGTKQRFGQYAINSSRIEIPLPWPALFYEEDPRVAYDMLYQHAVPEELV